MLRDCRLALRGLTRAPLFALATILTLGLAVGSATTVFAWLENMVLDPFPLVRDSGQLVALNTAAPDGSVRGAPPFSYRTFEEWRSGSESFAWMVATGPTRLNWRRDPGAPVEPLWAELVSSDYFTLLEVPAAHGRVFSNNDDRDPDVVVLSDRFWERAFRRDSSVVGASMVLNGNPMTIVGIAPPSFTGTVSGLAYDIWLPVGAQPRVLPGEDRLLNRNARWLQGLARLAPGVTITDANRELQRVATRISLSYGDTPPSSAAVRLLREYRLGSLVYPLFSAMLGMTGLVIVIAAANVASLMAVRGATRHHEIALHYALGANRYQIVRRYVIETVILALCGGALGLGLAAVFKESFRAFVPPTPVPAFINLTLDERIVAFAVALAFGCMVILTITNIVQVRAQRLSTVINASSKIRGFKSRGRAVAVVCQMVLALVALVGAGVFVRTLAEVDSMELGFRDPDDVFLVSLDFGFAMGNPARAIELGNETLVRVRAIPGVRDATLSTMVPLGFGGHTTVDTRVEGYEPGPNEDMAVERVRIADGYFETMQIPILSGRAIESTDRSGSDRAVVVNEAFVRRFWAGHDPLGRRLDQGEGFATVVGVARDAMYDDIGETPYPLVYVAYRQSYQSTTTLFVRTEGVVPNLADGIRRELSRVSPDLAMLDPRTLRQHMAASTFVPRVGATTLGVFGAVAVSMAALGLYAVIAYFVTLSTRDIGLRMALGATPAATVRFVLGHAMRLVFVSLIIGSVAGIAALRVLQARLVSVSGAPSTVLLAGIVVLVVSLAASLGPAWRAAHMDPVRALQIR
jgi:putative ABC transport system permease protein